jgi:ubiquinone/menaquinone biosynthesis C-methylase UbiE
VSKRRLREFPGDILNEHKREDLSMNANAYAEKKTLIENKFSYIKKMITIEKGMTFLDCGSGAGLVTIYAAEQGLKSFGIDIMPNAVKIAESNANLKQAECRFKTGPCENLPYDDDYFDVVFSLSTLEHTKDWRLCVKEMARVLKNKGVLYIQTTNALFPFTEEIKRFPLFSYYPVSLQKKIILWVAKNRPELIGNMPASFNITFHRFGRIKECLNMLNCDVYDVLELKGPGNPKDGAMRTVFYEVLKIKAFRCIWHFFMPCTEILAVKKRSPNDR